MGELKNKKPAIKCSFCAWKGNEEDLLTVVEVEGVDATSYEEYGPEIHGYNIDMLTIVGGCPKCITDYGIEFI